MKTLRITKDMTIKKILLFVGMVAAVPVCAQTTGVAADTLGGAKMVPASATVSPTLYARMPLLALGLLVRGQDAHYRDLRHEPLAERHGYAGNGMQLLPALVLVGLKTAGVESRSTWTQLAVAGAASTLVMASATEGLKRTTRVTRPDGSDRHSFPSGHTATAFMTATMLTHEYGHHSPWVGVGAYTLATATGLLRVSGHKHWLSDVFTGASIGMFSAEIGYWLASRVLGRAQGDTHSDPQTYSRDFRPSFAALYVGANIPLSAYALDGQTTMRTSAGSSVGAEGAYFFSPYVGVGGRVTLANTAVITQHTQAEDDRLDALSASAGAYLSYPLTGRWLLGSKLLGGYTRYSALSLSHQPLPARGGLNVGTGLSIAYRTQPHGAARLFVDYTLQPALSRQGDSHLHTLAAGLSLAVLL